MSISNSKTQILYLVVLCQQEFDILCSCGVCRLIVLCVAFFSFILSSPSPNYTRPLSPLLYFLPKAHSLYMSVTLSFCLSVCVTPLLPVRIVGKHCRRNHLLLAYLFLNPLCCRPFDLTVALVVTSISDRAQYLSIWHVWIFFFLVVFIVFLMFK